MPRKRIDRRPRKGTAPPWYARRWTSGGAMYRARPDALKAARSAARMSQEALAAAAGCSKAMIGHLESGHRDIVTGVLARAITTALTGDGSADVARFFAPHPATSQGSDTPDTQP